jgi:hypothetical protein
MLWGKREMFTVTQHAGLGLAKHLLDWAGVHTGHSAEAAATIAAGVAAAAAAVAEVEVVHSESAAVAVVAQAGSGSIAASQRAAGSSCCSWWRWRGMRRAVERRRGVSSKAACRGRM